MKLNEKVSKEPRLVGYGGNFLKNSLNRKRTKEYINKVNMVDKEIVLYNKS